MMAEMMRYAVFALLPIVSARIGYDLRPTQTNFATDQFDYQWGWTPMPTAAPIVPLDAFARLDRRQSSAYTYSPNDTCGFISAQSTDALTCNNNGLYCGFNAGYKAAGCCSSWTEINFSYTLLDCGFFTTCYDSTALAANCDSACTSNTHILRCGASAEPYCITWSFTDVWNGYTNLGCAAASGITQYLAVTWTPTAGATTTIPPAVTTQVTTTTQAPTTTQQTTTTTVAPQTTTTTSRAGTSTSSTTTPSSSSVSSSTSVSPLGTSTSFGTSTTSSSTSSDTPLIATTTPQQTTTSQSTTTSQGVIGSGGGSTTFVSTDSGGGVTTVTETGPISSNTGSSSAQGQNGGSSSSNTGAIAGGVVGGVAGLAIIAGLIWFLMRRRRRDPAVTPTPEVSQHTSMQYPYSPVSPNTQGGTSQFGSPQQVHEFPAAPVVGLGAYNHPHDHPHSNYQPGQTGQYGQGYGGAHEVGYGGSYGQGSTQAHEVSSEGTGSSRPLVPPGPYSNAPEAVPGGYRGVDPTGGGYNPNVNPSYGAEPGFYGRPYSEMP